MTHDEVRRPPDGKGRIPGPGLFMRRKCDKCGTPKGTEGGKRVRVWWWCKECVK